MDLPMLTDQEWEEEVGPHLVNVVSQIKRYRDEHGCSLAEAHQKGFGQQALANYERLTGFKETNPNALFHHRISVYGPPCTHCGKPLRTPDARVCAMCSSPRVS
jgi:hypothetical protein